MRLTLATLWAAMLAGPWAGCDRNLDPVTPPAAPPTERAPIEAAPPPDGGTLLLTPTRKLG
jgi:hypothetical protein